MFISKYAESETKPDFKGLDTSAPAGGQRHAFPTLVLAGGKKLPRTPPP